MIKGFLNRVRIDKGIKPIHFSKRKAPELIVDKEYYVCFGSNDTYPCILKKILHEYDSPEVEIEIPIRARSKKGFTYMGKISHHWVSTHILKADEIGITREEAVINTVTS